MPVRAGSLRVAPAPQARPMPPASGPLPADEVDVGRHRRGRQRHGRRARPRAARAASGALRAKRPRVRRERQLERDDPRRRPLPALGAERDGDLVPRLRLHPAHRAAPALPHPVPDAAPERRAGAGDVRAHRRVLPRVRRLPAAQARRAPLPPRRERARAPRARARGLARRRGHVRRVGGRRRAPLRAERRRRHRARRARPRAHDRGVGRSRAELRIARSRARQRRCGPSVRRVRAEPDDGCCECGMRQRRGQRDGRVGPITAALGGLAAGARARPPGQGDPRRARPASDQLRHPLRGDRRAAGLPRALAERQRPRHDGRRLLRRPRRRARHERGGPLPRAGRGAASSPPCAVRAPSGRTPACGRRSTRTGRTRTRSPATTGSSTTRPDGAPGRLLDDRRKARELPPLRAGALRPRRAARLRPRRSLLDARAAPARRRTWIVRAPFERRSLPRRPRGERRVWRHARRRATPCLPTRHACAARAGADGAPPLGARRRVPLRARARGRGAARGDATRWRARSTTSRAARGSGSAPAGACGARRGAGRSWPRSSPWRPPRDGRWRSASSSGRRERAWSRSVRRKRSRRR